MPVFPTSGLQAALLPTMLSVVLSRSVCQVVAGVTLSARLQGFASRAPSASNPAGNGHDSGNGSNKWSPGTEHQSVVTKNTAH